MAGRGHVNKRRKVSHPSVALQHGVGEHYARVEGFDRALVQEEIARRERASERHARIRADRKAAAPDYIQERIAEKNARSADGLYQNPFRAFLRGVKNAGKVNIR